MAVLDAPVETRVGSDLVSLDFNNLPGSLDTNTLAYFAALSVRKILCNFFLPELVLENRLKIKLKH